MSERENILGYGFEDIRAMQQKTYVPRTIDLSKDGKPKPTEADFKMLEKYGEDGLRKMEYFGVMDRLGIKI